MFRECLDGTIFELISEVFADRAFYEYLKDIFKNKIKSENFRIEIKNSAILKKLNLDDCYVKMLESILNSISKDDMNKLFLEHKNPDMNQIKKVFEPFIENYVESVANYMESEVTADIDYYNERITDSISKIKSPSLAVLQNVTDLFSDSMMIILDRLSINNAKEKVKSRNVQKTKEVEKYLEKINEDINNLSAQVEIKSIALKLDKLISLKDKLTDIFKQSYLDSYVFETISGFIMNIGSNIMVVSKRDYSKSLKNNYDDMLAFESMRNDLNQVLQLYDTKVKSTNLCNLQKNKDILSKKKLKLEDELRQLPNGAQIEIARFTFENECREVRKRIAELSELHSENEKKLADFSKNSRMYIMVHDLFNIQQINKDLFNMSLTLDNKLLSLKAWREELGKKLEDESNKTHLGEYKKDLELILRQDKLFQILEDNTGLKKEIDDLMSKLQIKKTSLSIMSENDDFKSQKPEVKNDSVIQRIKQELKQINKEFLLHKIKYLEALYENIRLEEIVDTIQDIGESIKELEKYKTQVESGLIKNNEDMVKKIVDYRKILFGIDDIFRRRSKQINDTINQTVNFKTHKSRLKKLKENYRTNSRDDLGILMLDVKDLESSINRLEVRIRRIRGFISGVDEVKKELDCLQTQASQSDDSIKDQIQQLEMYDLVLKGLDIKKTFADLRYKHSDLKKEIESKRDEIKDLETKIKKREHYLEAWKISDGCENKFEKYQNKAVRIAKNYRWNPSKRNELANKIKSVRDDLVNELISPIESENQILKNKLQKLRKVNENRQDKYDNLQITNANNKSNFTLCGSKSIQKDK